MDCLLVGIGVALGWLFAALDMRQPPEGYRPTHDGGGPPKGGSALS